MGRTVVADLATRVGVRRLVARAVWGEVAVELMEAVARGAAGAGHGFGVLYSCCLDAVPPELLVHAVTKLVRLDVSRAALLARCRWPPGCRSWAWARAATWRHW